MNIDVNVIPKTFNFCVKADCALAGSCLRFQAAECMMDSGANTIKILNLKNLRKFEDGKCTYFKPAEKVMHGKGLLKFLSSLPVGESKKAFTVLESVASSNRQFYRYRNGERTVTPELQEAMNRALKENGIEKELFFDEIVEVYSFN